MDGGVQKIKIYVLNYFLCLNTNNFLFECFFNKNFNIFGIDFNYISIICVYILYFRILFAKYIKIKLFYIFFVFLKCKFKEKTHKIKKNG
jgi:hypothetical protein